MQMAFLLTKADIELSKEEVLAVVGHESSWMHGNLLVVTPKSKEDAEALQRRLAFTSSIHEVLFSCPSSALPEKMGSYPWQGIYRENFSVRVHRLSIAQQYAYNRQEENAGRREEFSEQELAGYIWRAVRSPAVKLRNAVTGIHLFCYKETVVCTRELAHDTHKFGKRRPHLRAFSHSGSLHPRLARALVNLLGAKAGETIMDPCCGSGGLLIEAALMGFGAEGQDVNRKMVWGCMCNMAQQGLKEHHVAVGDALSLDGKWTHVVTDLPYGLNSAARSQDRKVSMKRMSGKEELEKFYASFFRKLKQVLGKRAVIVMPHFVDHKRIIAEAGLRIEKEFTQYVHGSLTRRIVVLTPPWID